MSNKTPYEFKIPDRQPDYIQAEDDDEDEYGENSCPSGCCDHDCECDDCLRCSNNGVIDTDSYVDDFAAAAA